MERENQRLIKATRRADRDRKRLEQGSNYHSEDDVGGKIEDSETESDQSSDSYYDSEGSSGGVDEDVMADHSDLDIDGLQSGDGASKSQLKPTSALADIRG